MRRGLSGSGELFYFILCRYHLVHMKREGAGPNSVAHNQNSFDTMRNIMQSGWQVGASRQPRFSL